MEDKELTETLLGKQLPSVDFEDMMTLLGIAATCSGRPTVIVNLQS
jgi:hypothetical protein